MSRFRCTLVAVATVVLALLVSGSSATAVGPPRWEPVAPQSPDSEVNVTGAPFTGTTTSGEVRGLVDDLRAGAESYLRTWEATATHS